MILEDKENSGAWSALGTMLYNGDCAGYTLPSEESFQNNARWFQIETFRRDRWRFPGNHSLLGKVNELNFIRYLYLG